MRLTAMPDGSMIIDSNKFDVILNNKIAIALEVELGRLAHKFAACGGFEEKGTQLNSIRERRVNNGR